MSAVLELAARATRTLASLQSYCVQFPQLIVSLGFKIGFVNEHFSIAAGWRLGRVQLKPVIHLLHLRPSSRLAG